MRLRYLIVAIALLSACPAAQAQWVELTQFDTAFYNEVFFADNSLGFVTGHYGSVLRTANGGATWTSVTLPQAGTSSNRDVSFVTTSVGFISGEDGIWKSTDGGLTWSDITPSGATTIGSSSHWFRNSSVGVWGYGSCFDTTVTFWRTTDGGANWASTTSTHSADVAVGGITYTNGVFYAVGGSGKYWKSTDDGATWTVGSTGSGGWQEDLISTGGVLFGASADGTSCGTTGGGKIMRSTNGGTSWTATSYSSTIIWGVSMISSTNGWAVGDRAHAYQTTDGGATWFESSCGLSPNDRLDDVHMIDANNGFAVGDGIYRYFPNQFYTDQDTIDFGAIILNRSSADSNARALSNGNAGTITARAILGTDAASFTSTATLTNAVAIPACGTATTPIRFTPRRLGPHLARIDVTISGRSTPITIYLRGVGVRPTIEATRRHDLDTLICEEFDLDTIPIRNLGNAPLVIDSIAIANLLGIFTIEGTNFPVQIAPSASHTLVVRGRATSTGMMSARLYLYTNDPDFVDSARTIDLFMLKRRTGIVMPRDTTIRIPSEALNTPSRHCVMVHNPGDVPMTVQSVVGGPAGNPYIQTEFSNSLTIPSGDSALLCFRGNAGDTVDRCRTFTITANPCGQTLSLTLCYQAVEGKPALTSPDTLSALCGSDELDTISIGNNGSGELRYDSISVIGLPPSLNPRVTAQRPVVIPTGSTKRLPLYWTAAPRRDTGEALIILHKGTRRDTLRIILRTIGPEIAPLATRIDLDTVCPDVRIDTSLGLVNHGEREGSILGVDTIMSSVGRVVFEPPGMIVAGGSGIIRIQLEGLPTGPFIHRFIMSSACERVDTIEIVGIVAPPALVVAPDTIDLGELDEGVARDVVLRAINVSGAPLDATVTATGHADLTATGSVQIDGADSGSITISLVTTAVGAQSALVRIGYDGVCSGETTAVVRWRVKPLRPYLELADVDTAYCDAPFTATLVVHNPGTLPVDVTGVRLEQGIDFVLPNDPVPATIVPGTTLGIAIDLTSTRRGLHTDRMIVIVGADTLSTPLSIYRAEPHPRLLDTAMGNDIDTLKRTVIRACETDPMITFDLLNDGSIADTFDVIAIHDEVLGLDGIGPLPLDIGEQRRLSFPIEELPDGRHRFKIIVRSHLCGTETILEGVIDITSDILIAPDTVRIGTVCLGETGDAEILLRAGTGSVLIDDALAILHDDIAVDIDSLIYPVDSIGTTIHLSYTPRTVGTVGGEIRLNGTEPCDFERRIVVIAEAVECPIPLLSLSSTEKVAGWGDTVALPVLLSGSRAGDVEEIVVDIEYDEGFLTMIGLEERISSTLPSIDIVDGIGADAEGLLQVRFGAEGRITAPDEPLVNDTIGFVRFVVLRGDVTSSLIRFHDVIVRPKGSATVGFGRIDLNDECEAQLRLLTMSTGLKLNALHPNPTSGAVTIDATIPFDGEVILELFDASGVLISTPFVGPLPTGAWSHTIALDGLPSGVYTVRLSHGVRHRSERFILNK